MPPRATPLARRRWDIFCRVVDNFGDAGVSWRLARQLAAEHGAAVTLWLDLLPALERIAQGIAPERDRQECLGVTVRRWDAAFPSVEPADVVIEAFGCGLPDGYLAAMTACPRPPAWFVLEYLSAEPWVEQTHGLASPHPQLPLTRRFWFPGFTPATGGLLRERGLIARRDAFRADPAGAAALWTSLGVGPPSPGTLAVSMFCYPDCVLAALLGAWAEGDRPIACFVPEGIASGALDAWTGGRVPHAHGAPFVRGPLSLHTIPFVDQERYDRLLWACDVNFVRGEDSIVRAQWAARPFVWQIYPQAESAHLPKLAALLDRYAAGLAPAAAAAVRRINGAWNADPASGPVEPAWLDFAAVRPQLNAYGPAWAAELAGQVDLATGLVDAVESGV